ncbi:MAG: hypothetical protein Q9167_001039 [Letrouitia subvulpina]
MSSSDPEANDDGIQESDWLTKPKFWPVGYILRSSYSPLALEEQFPEHKWRDAFEDLLAVESSGIPVGMSGGGGFDLQARMLRHLQDYKAEIDKHNALLRNLQENKNSWGNGADLRKRVNSCKARVEQIRKLCEKQGKDLDDLYYQFRGYDNREMEKSAWMEDLAEREMLPGWVLREEPIFQDVYGGRWVGWKKLAERFEDRGKFWVNTDGTMSGKPHFYVANDQEFELCKWELAERVCKMTMEQDSGKKYPWEESQENGIDPKEYDDADEDEEDDFEFSLDSRAYIDAIASMKSSTQEHAKPSVLSQLTRTERTTSPDGTVITKVVLKKRFSDGTEENEETVSTSRVGEQ